MGKLYSGPILDFHTHPFICKEQNICFYKDTVAGTLDEYMEDMERCGIERYAGSPLENEPSSRVPEFKEIRRLNREALELREATKGRYIPGFHVHPAYQKESMEEIRLMEREDVRLVGELVPYWMGWNDYGYNAPEVYELIQAAGEAGMIISLHSGSPDEMDALLEACPHTVIVGAHPGEKSDFLRHIERTRMLVHIVDVAGEEGRDPYEDYLKINAELKKYGGGLEKLKQIIVANKTDFFGAEEKLAEFRKKLGRKKVIPVSALTGAGLDVLKKEIYVALEKLPPVKPLEFEEFNYVKPDKLDYEILNEGETFVIVGTLVDVLKRNVVMDDMNSLAYLQKVLRDRGIIDKLRKMGANEKSTVIIGGEEFEFVD